MKLRVYVRGSHLGGGGGEMDFPPQGNWQYLGASLVARAGWRRSDAGGL